MKQIHNIGTGVGMEEAYGIEHWDTLRNITGQEQESSHTAIQEQKLALD